MQIIKHKNCQCECGEYKHSLTNSPILESKIVESIGGPNTTRREAKRKRIKQNLRVWVPNREEHSKVVQLSGVSLVENLLVHGKKEEALNQIGKLLFKDFQNNISDWQPKEIEILGELL